MKKCGIITYHFATNYGAMLQCYALKNAIEKLGADAEVLNYVSEKQLDNNSLYRTKQGLKGFIKNALVFPFHHVRSKRQKRCIEFRKKYIVTNQKQLENINELKQYCDSRAFNVLISGSDQVWNPNVYDFNEAFFYPFATSSKKVGYAVSIGNAKKSDLEYYVKWINEFDKITVREKQSIKLIESLTGKKNIVSVVDPVFLVPKEHWKSILSKVKQQNYLVCYFVKNHNIDKKISLAHKIAADKGLKVIIINSRITKYNFFEHVVSDAGPIEFLSLINGADFVCTDSFHGTAFSLLLEKQFITLIENSEGTDNRKLGLLDTVGLRNRSYSLDAEPLGDFDSKLDYMNIRVKIESMRLESTKILENLIGN